MRFETERKMTRSVVGLLRSLLSPQSTSKLGYNVCILKVREFEEDLMTLKTEPIRAIAAEVAPPTVRCSSGIMIRLHISTFSQKLDLVNQIKQFI